MVRAMVPWAERLPRPFMRLEREFENLMERFLGPEEGRVMVWGGFAPTLNVAESEEGFEVTVELPGMKAEEVQVEMKNGDLWISGEKKEEKEEKKKDYYVSERRFGSFQRSFQLPDGIDEEKIEANFKNGVLTVALPKSPAAQKPEKSIAIKAK